MKDEMEVEKEVEKEAKLPKVKSAVVGLNRELAANLKPNDKMINAVDKICVFYSNDTARVFDFTESENRIAEVEDLNAQIWAEIEDENMYKTYYSDSKTFEREEKKAEKTLEGKDYSKLKKAATTLGVAGVVGATALTGVSCARDLKDSRTIDELGNIPDMHGKDIPFYRDNALENGQKDFTLKNMTAWVENVNAKEAWMKKNLTEQQMKQYGLTESESIFGFTAEDAYSLALRFGHYSLDEYVTLTGGKEIDTVAIMNDAHSQSNGVLSSIISYYICSDECDLNIETLINFSDSEKAKIDQIETMLREFKSLQNEGKEKEAKAKMVEMKEWFNVYARSVDYEQDNAKSYILRTFLPACGALSGIYQYTDTIELEVYDTKKDVNTTKEIKTALFDEIMMRTLVLGFTECDGVGAFDAEAYLEEHNISPSRYNLLNTDVTSSLADKSVSGQSEKLEQANIYIANLRNDDLTAEAAHAKQAGNIIINLAKGKLGDQVSEQMSQYGNVITSYDELTYGTYDMEILLEMVNNYLKENNIYPKNINYFRSAKLAEISMEYKDNNGVTKGKKGDVIKQTHQENVNIDNVVLGSNDVVLDKNGNKTTMEQAKEEARKEHEQQTGIKDASTPEAEQKADNEAQNVAILRQQVLQGVYNATFNYYNGGAVIEDGFDTSNTYGQNYTDAWAYSSDLKIVEYYNKGKVDGLAHKNAKEQSGAITGGDEIIFDEFKDIETSNQPINPVPSVDNTTNNNTSNSKPKDEISNSKPEEYKPVVQEPEKNESTPSNGQTDSNDNGIFDQFEDAEMSDEPIAPVPSVDNTTKDVSGTQNNDGYSNTAPEGFAPVVDSNTEITNGEIEYFSFTEEQLMEYINTEEGNAWFESVTTSQEIVDTNEPVMIK